MVSFFNAYHDFTKKDCIVSSARLQFSYTSTRILKIFIGPTNPATVLFQLLTMVDYQRKFNETAKKSTLNLPS